MAYLDKLEELPVFDLTDRGYRVRVWRLTDPKDALVEFDHGVENLRKYLIPAYKMWNVAAHFNDMVDAEIFSKENAIENRIGDHVG